MHSNPLQVGQIVKWMEPHDAAEADERYVVLEIRGDTVLAEFVCNMYIPPVGQYPAADLIPE